MVSCCSRLKKELNFIVLGHFCGEQALWHGKSYAKPHEMLFFLFLRGRWHCLTSHLFKLPFSLLVSRNPFILFEQQGTLYIRGIFLHKLIWKHPVYISQEYFTLKIKLSQFYPKIAAFGYIFPRIYIRSIWIYSRHFTTLTRKLSKSVVHVITDIVHGWPIQLEALKAEVRLGSEYTAESD